MASAMKTIFQLVCTRLQTTKSNLYPIRAAQFFAFFCGLYGGQAFVNVTNEIQPNLGMILAGQIWLKRITGAASSKILAKGQVIGLTRYACEGGLLAEDTGRQIFSQINFGILTILTSDSFSKEEKDLFDEAPTSYDATFTSLKYATKTPDDAFSSIVDPVEYFVGALKSLSESHPGAIVRLIQPVLSSDPKVCTGFENMLKAKGVVLM
jgi:exportin-2 (importin alpha re-exporter)